MRTTWVQPPHCGITYQQRIADSLIGVPRRGYFSPGALRTHAPDRALRTSVYSALRTKFTASRIADSLIGFRNAESTDPPAVRPHWATFRGAPVGYISGNAHTVRTSVPVRVLRTPTPVALRTKLTALRIADFCVLCIADSLIGFRKADTSFLPDCGVTPDPRCGHARRSARCGVSSSPEPPRSGAREEIAESNHSQL